jgi:hypothetical protein
MLIIQKFWRNACVSTSYNSFNIDFHLTYHDENDVRICVYINTKFDVNKWSMYFSSENVCTLKLIIIDDCIINIHNVYNASFVFYTFKIVLIVLKTMKSKLINENKHILLNDFNLHHSMWKKYSNRFNTMQQINSSTSFCRCKCSSHYRRAQSFEKHDIWATQLI